MKKNLFFVFLILALCSGATISCKEEEGNNNGGNAINNSATRVVGKVCCDGIGIPDVLVTDGVRFISTDKSGFFIFDLSKDAEYLSVVTPAGYVADYSGGAPQFYKKISANVTSYEFNLSKMTDSKDYNLIVMADPQTKNQDQFDLFKGTPMEDLIATATSLSKERMTVGICLGDIVQDAMNLFASYKAEIQKTGIPFYAVIGNHDFNKQLSGNNAAADFKASFGPVNYAFFLGNDLVIALNDMKYLTNKKYEEGYPDETKIFLNNLLQNIPKTTKLYVAQHVPIHRWWKDYPIEGGEEVLEMLDGYDVTFLSGHTHVQNITPPLRESIHDHNISGFLGAWWIIDVCRDGTPRGYEIFTRKGFDLSWIFHTVEGGERNQFEIIRPGQSSRNPKSVVLNVWDVDDDWVIEWSEDGVKKGVMERTKDISYRYFTEIEAAYPSHSSTYDPNVNKHFFVATPSEGAKKVTINVTSHFGQKWTETVEL